MTTRSEGFPPIIDHRSSILILGSMPGEESLRKKQYYAHPRNSFWYIMSRISGFDAGCDYSTRQEALLGKGIGVWDVLHSCCRKGSLDSSIESDSMIPNDFMWLFGTYPSIRGVLFNGTAARRIYQKMVMDEVSSQFGYLRYDLLPSSSPAMARLNREQKTALWISLLF